MKQIFSSMLLILLLLTSVSCQAKDTEDSYASTKETASAVSSGSIEESTREGESSKADVITNPSVGEGSEADPNAGADNDAPFGEMITSSQGTATNSEPQGTQPAEPGDVTEDPKVTDPIGSSNAPGSTNEPGDTNGQETSTGTEDFDDWKDPSGDITLPKDDFL